MPEQPGSPPTVLPTPSTHCRDALGWLIEARCSCGHTATLSVNSLVNRFGDRGLWQLLPFLKCKQCGAQPFLIELVEDMALIRHRRPMRRVRLL